MDLIEEKESLMILQMLNHFSSIIGKTRIIKYLFLLEKEGNLGLLYSFESKHFGPYSPKIDEIIMNLKELELISETLGRDGKTITYNLTSKGFKIKEVNNTSFEVIKVFRDVLDKYKDMPLKQLINIIYAKYPEYTILSKLK